jgi:hypothetical protein
VQEQLEQKTADENTDKDPSALSHIIQCHELLKVPDLIAQHAIDIRCFYLQDGRAFFGVIFFETTDSFLVGANAKLVRDGNRKITAEPLSPMPVIRIFKSSTVNVSKALPEFQYHYYLYLRDRGVKLLPDYLVGDVFKQVLDFIQFYADEEHIQQTSHTSKLPSELATEKKEVSGMSEFGFVPFLISEKIH